MLQAVIAALHGNAGHRILCAFEQYLRVIETDFRQVLMRTHFHDGFEYTAEMKETYAAVVGQLLQADVLFEMRENVVLCFFYSSQMKSFQR